MMDPHLSRTLDSSQSVQSRAVLQEPPQDWHGEWLKRQSRPNLHLLSLNSIDAHGFTSRRPPPPLGYDDRRDSCLGAPCDELEALPAAPPRALRFCALTFPLQPPVISPVPLQHGHGGGDEVFR